MLKSFNKGLLAGQMIKIQPLLITDYVQARSLLTYEPHFSALDKGEGSLFLRALGFWQHWLPCTLHLLPSVYVAREDGTIIGLIALHSVGKSRSCWEVEHVVVHAEHRGRGIAQELLRYVFALFGGQGVDHFVAEVSDENSQALQLFGACGFRRAAKICRFYIEVCALARKDMGARGFTPETASMPQYHLATAQDAHGLLQVFQDALPPDLRTIYSWRAEDFAAAKEEPKAEFTDFREKLMGKRIWYWLARDSQRGVVTSAARVTVRARGHCHLELVVHPGWQHEAGSLVNYCLQQLRTMPGCGFISAQSFEFDHHIVEALQANGMSLSGSGCLMIKEHWIRARKPRVQQRSAQAIAKPAVNFPLATEFKSPQNLMFPRRPFDMPPARRVLLPVAITAQPAAPPRSSTH